MKKAMKLLAVILCATLIGGLLPMNGVKVEAKTNKNIASQILNQDSKTPSDFDEEDTTNPLGETENQPFMISTENELLVYSSYDGNYNEYTLDDYAFNDDTLPYKNDIYTASNINAATAVKTNIGTPIEGYAYLQAVSFDPDGDGRKNYVGYVGYCVETESVDVIVQNANTGAITYTQIGHPDWLTSNFLNSFLSANFFSITAGDYDNDGKDTLIVHYPSSDKDNRVLEVSYDVEKKKIKFTADKLCVMADVLKNTSFMTSTDVKYQPVVSLATGDFDGDEIEELAVSVGLYNVTGSTKNGMGSKKKEISGLEEVSTQIMLFDRESGKWAKIESFTMADKLDLKSKSGSETSYYYQLMHGGAITAGDVDSDDIDEIIAVGYTSYSSGSEGARIISDGKSCSAIYVYNMDKSNYVSSVIDLLEEEDGTFFGRTDLSKVEMSSFQKNQFKYDDDYSFPQVQVACAQINGASSDAKVFISGQIYAYHDAAPSLEYTPKIMGQTFNTMMDGKNTSNMCYVAGVAVGNFTGNDAGREQFVYSVGFKQKGYRDYAFYYGIVGGCAYGDEMTNGEDGTPRMQYGSNANYFESDMRGGSGDSVTGKSADGSQVFYDKGDNWQDKKSKVMNCLLVSVDIDDDGLIGRYAGKSFLYTDPQVAAVLQKAPYFDGINDPGETSYSVTVEYEHGKSRDQEISSTAGFGIEIGDSLKFSLECGYVHSWSEGWEKSRGTSYTNSFSAEAYDQVIVRRIPMTLYAYDIYDRAKDEFTSGAYIVSDPGEPVYYQFSVDEYNDFVETYNRKYCQGDKAAYALKQITSSEMPMNTAGDPYAYYSSWKQYGAGATSLTSNNCSLGHSGGSSSSEWETSSSSTKSKGSGNGFTVSLSLQKTFVKDMFAASAIGGVDGMWTDTSFKTTTNAIGSSGSVTNIVDDDLIAEGYDPDAIALYGFSWEFGQWERELGGLNNEKIPFFGYIVFDITSPAIPVDDLAVDLVETESEEGDVLRLTWTDPAEIDAERGANDGVNVYFKTEDEFELIGTAKKGETSFDYADIDGSKQYTFMVRTFSSSKNAYGEDDVIESLDSNIVIYNWSYKGADGNGIKSIEKIGTNDNIDTYMITFTDDSTFEYQVVNGKDGKDGKDGRDGKDGADGRDGVSVASTITFPAVRLLTIWKGSDDITVLAVPAGSDISDIYSFFWGEEYNALVALEGSSLDYATELESLPNTMPNTNLWITSPIR